MRSLFLITPLALSLGLSAQTDAYRSVMQANILLVDTAKSPQQFEKAATIFSAAYEAGGQWQALYYQCFALVAESKCDADADHKESALRRAGELLDRLPAQNDEALVLKAWHAQALLNLHHELWATYLPVIGSSLDLAGVLNPDNPRVDYLKGLMAYFMPENMGGGKEKALRYFRQALDKFGRFQSRDEYAPQWGRLEVKKFIP